MDIEQGNIQEIKTHEDLKERVVKIRREIAEELIEFVEFKYEHTKSRFKAIRWFQKIKKDIEIENIKEQWNI